MAHNLSEIVFMDFANPRGTSWDLFLIPSAGQSNP